MNACLYTETGPMAPVGIGGLLGNRIIQTLEMREWYRKPRSKRRRIHDKWEARPENWRPRRDYLLDKLHGVVYCHPIAYRVLAEQLKAVSMPNVQDE